MLAIRLFVVAHRILSTRTWLKPSHRRSAVFLQRSLFSKSKRNLYPPPLSRGIVLNNVLFFQDFNGWISQEFWTPLKCKHQAGQNFFPSFFPPFSRLVSFESRNTGTWFFPPSQSALSVAWVSKDGPKIKFKNPPRNSKVWKSGFKVGSLCLETFLNQKNKYFLGHLGDLLENSKQRQVYG